MAIDWDPLDPAVDCSTDLAPPSVSDLSVQTRRKRSDGFHAFLANAMPVMSGKPAATIVTADCRTSLDKSDSTVPETERFIPL